jgi:ribosomal protein L9
MKATKNSQKILREYLSRTLSSDEFEEAMKHPELSTRQKLQITDAYFASIGSRDITDQLIGQASINVRWTKEVK